MTLQIDGVTSQEWSYRPEGLYFTKTEFGVISRSEYIFNDGYTVQTYHVNYKHAATTQTGVEESS